MTCHGELSVVEVVRAYDLWDRYALVRVRKRVMRVYIECESMDGIFDYFVANV